MYTHWLELKGFRNILPGGMSSEARQACADGLNFVDKAAKKNRARVYMARGEGPLSDTIRCAVYDGKNGRELLKGTVSRDAFIRTPNEVADQLASAADSAKFYRMADKDKKKAQKAADAAKPQVPLSQKIVNLLKSH